MKDGFRMQLRAGANRSDNHGAVREARREEVVQETVLQPVQEVDVSDARSITGEHM